MMHIKFVEKAFRELTNIEKKENYLDKKIDFLKKGLIRESFKQDFECFCNFFLLIKAFFSLNIMLLRMKNHISNGEKIYAISYSTTKEIEWLSERSRNREAGYLSRSFYEGLCDFIRRHTLISNRFQLKRHSFINSKSFKVLKENTNIPDPFNIYKKTMNAFVKMDRVLIDDNFRLSKMESQKIKIARVISSGY
jgi:chaperonin cofactor prefoldin